MMKTTKKIGWLIPAVLLAGMLMLSCNLVEPEYKGGNEGEETDGETAMLCFGVTIKGGMATKATDDGLPGESNVHNFRVILYDMTGVARYIRNYTVDQAHSDPNLLAINPPSYQTVAFQVVKRDYMAVVLVNHMNFNQPPEAYPQPSYNVEYRTRDVGHSMSVLYTPIDFNGIPVEANSWKYWAFFTLTGFTNSAPHHPREWSEDAGCFYMSNADGAIPVTSTNLWGTKSEAEANPISINVERSVAKVAVKKGSNFSILSGAEFDDNSLVWRVDIMNKVMYPLRRQTNTAPFSGSAPGPNEMATTDRALRYAVDPNWDNLSNQRNSSLPKVTLFDRYWTENDLTRFFYNPQLTWSLDGVIRSDNFEYTTENTMAAEEQYEDVTTRILIHCNFRPPLLSPRIAEAAPGIDKGIELTGELATKAGNAPATRAPYLQPPPAAGVSFYTYSGRAFSLQTMNHFLKYPPSIDTDTHPELQPLKDLCMDNTQNAALRAAFGLPANVWDIVDAVTEPAEAGSYNGVNFYKRGISYYGVPIRHFNDIQSPVPMGYGRWGVVRNNYYMMTINSISWPGSPTIPDPTGPDDKPIPAISVQVSVVPWTVRNQEIKW